MRLLRRLVGPTARRPSRDPAPTPAQRRTSTAAGKSPPVACVKGMRDVVGAEARRLSWVEDTAKECALAWGYGEVRTPILEGAEVFRRPLGEQSDVVTKEMYQFEDVGGAQLVLRPEATAGTARAMTRYVATLPQKWFYVGPMFRRERPQRGRYRQFQQVGVEHWGSNDPLCDVESMSLARHFLGRLGVADKLALHLNSLGDDESRQRYSAVLTEYLQGHREQLSELSQQRLAQGTPLRILDSKAPGDAAICAGAPSGSEHWNAASREWFEAVRQGLDALGIAYTIDPRLVRGLDYYHHTVWEFVTEAGTAQSAVLAGGRYHGLTRAMGARVDVPGVGWAAGVDRLALLCEADSPFEDGHDVCVVQAATSPAVDLYALRVLEAFRGHGLRAVTFRGFKTKKQLQRATASRCKMAAVVGEDEASSGSISLKNLQDGTQERLPFNAGTPDTVREHLARLGL